MSNDLNTEVDLIQEDQTRLWDGLANERVSRIAGDDANNALSLSIQNSVSDTERRLSTEVIHREEGDLNKLGQLNALTQALSDYRIKTDAEINAEKLIRQQLGVDLNVSIQSAVSTFDHKEYKLYQAINEVQSYAENSNAAMDARVKKYEHMLQDIKMDSIQITMDNGQIKMGAWTILSQARQWDLQILDKLRGFQEKTVEDVDRALEEFQNQLPIKKDIIREAMEQLASQPTIIKLDKLLNEAIDSQHSLEDKLIQETLERQRQMVKQAELEAQERAAIVESLATEMANESKARVDALLRESEIRQEQLNLETQERLEQIALLEDGFTQDITHLEEADASMLTAFTNYKASTDNTLANVRTDIEANASATEATASKVDSIDLRLTGAEVNVASAVNKVDTALSQNSALSSQVSALNAALGDKVNNSSFNVLESKVSEVDGKVSSQGQAITQLEGRINTTNNNLSLKADTTALNSLSQEVTQVSDKVTATANETTGLKSRVDLVENQVSIKADASVLNDYYTKSESSENAQTVAAGEVNKYDANLVIGGVNLIPNSFDIGQWSNHGTAWPLEADVINGVRRIRRIGGTEPTIMSNYTFEFVDLPVGTTYTISVKVRPIGSDYLLGFYGSDNSIKLCKADQWTTLQATVKAATQPDRIRGLVSKEAQIGVWVEVKEWQAEIGNKATSWAPSPKDFQTAIEANATALQTTNAEVARVDDKTTVNTNSITSLAGEVTQVKNGLATKAESSALQNYYTKTEAAENATTVAAGEVAKYDANLIIGGANLLKNSNFEGELGASNWYVDGGSWIKQQDAVHGTVMKCIYGSISHDWLKLEQGSTFVFSAMVKSPVDRSILFEVPLHFWAGKDYTNQGKYEGLKKSHDVIPAGVWTKIWVVIKLTGDANTVKPIIYDIQPLDGFEIAWTKLEKGNKVTDWTPNDQEIQQSINANANAIQTVNAEVARVNGEVVSTANSVNNLSSNVGMLQGSINEVRQTVTNNQESTNTLVTSLRSGMADADDVSMMMRNATVLYEDFNFKQGDNGNGIKVYNNYDNGALLWQFTDKLPDNPVASTRQLQFTHNGGYTTPELGGFYQLAQSRPNAVFVVKFVAKLPVGFNFNLASNSIGYGASSNFIGGSEGTGKFKTYYGVFRCGYTGDFSTLGFVYVSGAQPSPDNPLIWYLASSTVYDCFDSKVAPDSVINGIAEAKSTASTAVNKAEATAMIAQDIKASLDNTNANISTNYYTKADMTGVVAQQVNLLESQRVIGGTNLWSLSVANMVSEQGAHSLEVKRPEEDEYWVKVTATSSGVTLVRFDNCLVDTNTPPVEGEDYVISFELSSNWHNRLSTIYMYLGGYATRIEATDVMLDPAKWTRFSFTLKANGTAVGGASQMIGFLLEESKGWSPNSVLSIRHVQCQRGTISTQFEKSTVKLSTKIKETSESVNGIMGVKTVTIDNNGVMSGYGLISELKNGQVNSSFGVNANNFFIGAPAGGKKPFMVTTGHTDANGVTYPAGTWIDTALIANATIGGAKIQNASITNAQIANLDATKITSGTIAAGRITADSLSAGVIGTAHLAAGAVTADKMTVTSLSALSANLGMLVTYKDPAYPNKARMVITGSLITVYDDNNKVRVKLGLW